MGHRAVNREYVKRPEHLVWYLQEHHPHWYAQISYYDKHKKGSTVYAYGERNGHWIKFEHSTIENRGNILIRESIMPGLERGKYGFPIMHPLCSPSLYDMARDHREANDWKDRFIKLVEWIDQEQGRMAVPEMPEFMREIHERRLKSARD